MRYLVILSIVMFVSSPVAFGVTEPMAGGKPAKFWLAASEEYWAGLPAKSELSPIPFMNEVAQKQVEIHDVSGAMKTIIAMEGRVSKEIGTFGFDYDMLQTISAETSAGRTVQAQQGVNTLGGVNGSAVFGVPVIILPCLVRLNQAGTVTSTIQKQTDAGTRARLYCLMAWPSYASRQSDLGDQMLNAALRELASIPAAKNAFMRYSTLLRLLAYRGRYQEAITMNSAVGMAEDQGARLADLILLLSDNGRPKEVVKFAKLIQAQMKKHPLPRLDDALKVVVALAEAGDIAESKSMLQLLASGSEKSSENVADLDQARAKVDVWARDFSSADQLLAQLDGPQSRHHSRFDNDLFQFHWDMARAYAAADRDADGLKMADEAVEGNKEIPMLDVITCEARVGHAELACQQLSKFSATMMNDGVDHLATGWALAKDSKGVQAWLDGLDTNILKAEAAMGVAEGLLHTHLRDPYESPTWRHEPL